MLHVMYRHPVQHLDQKCWLKKIGGRLTYRQMYIGAQKYSETHSYLRWCMQKQIAGPSIGADKETIDAFRWILYTIPVDDREPEDWRGDCDFEGEFWSEAAQIGIGAFPIW